MKRGQLALFLAVTACDGADEPPLVADDPIACSAPSLFESTVSAGDLNTTAELVAFVDDAGERELQFVDGSSVRYTIDDDVGEPLVVGPALIDVRAGVLDCFGEGCDVSVVELTHPIDGRFLIFGTVNALNDAETSREQLAGTPVSMRKAADACPGGGASALSPAVLVVDTDEGDVELLPSESAPVTIEGAAWVARAGSALRTQFVQDTTDCADCPPVGVYTATSIELLLYRLDQR